MSDVVARAKAALEGTTPGPWTHCTAPHPDSGETHAEYLAGTLIGTGEPLHVVTAESPELEYAYIVPAVTGDGPTSNTNAEFIAAARTLVPELVAELERTQEGARTLGRIIDRTLNDVLDITGLRHLMDETGDGPWDVVWEKLAEMPGDIERLTCERIAFCARLGFGDNVSEPAAELADVVDSIEQAFSESRDHYECPRLCEECGERLAATFCPDCYGSGCHWPMSANSGAYVPCETCGEAGWIHEGCAGKTYAELAAEVERLHSWDGLMSLLDEHYPDDIFPTMEDLPGRDSGPRIISLIRRINDIREDTA